jgi:hypothetical protein
VIALAIAAVMLVRVLRAPAPLPPLATAATASEEPSAPPAAPEDRTPEIRGRILDADGNAVAGAAVRLVATSPPFTVYGDTKSDGGGGFSFPHVGPWRVRVVADHGADGIVTSAVLQAAPGQTVEVTLVLSAAGAVSGTVVDGAGQPVAGAAVSVEGVPWIVPAATSDAAGAFRFTTVPDEATSLVAVARGYRTSRAALARSGAQTELVVRIVLTAAEPVSGTVLDDEGNPIGARVVACEEQPAEVRVRSDADGTFQLPPSAIGCDVIAEHGEHAPSDPVLVVEGRPVVLRLKAGGTIDGVVVDDRGSGVPAFSVGIESFTPARGRGFDRVGPQTFEDGHGSFRWEKLAPGTYVLTALTPGRPPARSAAVDVRGGVVTRGVRIVLAPGGTLVGHVYDASHAPLAGVDLRFDAVSSVLDSKASAQTDASGQYRLEGAPSGPLTMRVHKDGFRVRLVSGLRVESGGTLQQDVTLVAQNGGPGMELGGIGATLAQKPEGISFGDVSATDPAGRAGLRAGDRILRIDGESTDGMSLADVLQRLRGEPGTSVGVSALRPETGESVELTIVRGTIVR